MRRQLAAFAAVVAFPAAAAAPGTPNPEIAAIVAEISPARIEATIRQLVAFGTRNSFSPVDDEKRGIGAARRCPESNRRARNAITS